MLKTDVHSTNKRTALNFIKNAIKFLNLPKNLFESDIKECIPGRYKNAKGKAAKRRAVKALVFLNEAEANLLKLQKLLK